MSKTDELLGRVDDDKFRDEREQGARLTFSGKSIAKRLYRKVQPRISRRLAKYSVGSEEEQARNQVIEGENLQAMVTLYRERGQVDLILTDPPYNTGNDFRYNDRWEEDPNDPGLGEFVSPDDGASHTKWMRFMWPRLQMMKAMLKLGGVLAICIDYRELFHLGQMLDELFHEGNRLGIINWQKSYSPRNDKDHISAATEYILVYARDREAARTGMTARTAEMDARYGSPDGDPQPWKSGDLSAKDEKKHLGMVYAIQSPFNGEFYYPPKGRHWGQDKRNIKAWLEEWGTKYEEADLNDGRPKALVMAEQMEQARAKAQEKLQSGPWPRVYFGTIGEAGPAMKRYLTSTRKGFVPTTYWANEDYDEPFEIGSTSWEHPQSGHSQTGVTELDAIIGKGHEFETVKPLRLFEKIVQLWCPPDGLVLDPFAGSGTTGHAVLTLNANAEGSERRFIMIEQGRPEKGDPYARSLLADRLKRVITGNWANGKGEALGGAYRFVQLQNTVDAKALLAMERDEMTDAVIASHYDANRRGGPSLIIMTNENYCYLVARNSLNEGFYLVWGGSAVTPVFTEEVYDVVVAEAIKAGLKPFYHVYARFNLFQSDDVHFCQIPNQILMDFGLDLNDAFNNEEGDW